MAPKRTHTLTGFVTRATPPTHYTTRQANRMLHIRNPQIADVRRNLKHEKCRVDWIISQDLEILICFPNRQEFVNYTSTHAQHLFGPKASYFIPPTATQPAPWILNLNKNNITDKGLFSDSDLDSGSEPTNHKTAPTMKLKNTKYDTQTLLESDTDTEITTPISATTSKTPPTPNIKTPHTSQMATSNKNQTSQTTTQNNTQTSQGNTALQIHNHTDKSNNPFYIKTLASQLQIHTHTHRQTHTHIHTHTVTDTRTHTNAHFISLVFL